MTEASRLAVLVDGATIDPEAARALWTEFSAHMDENVGDMAGFAKKKGWQSVAPEFREGKAVLVVKTGGPMAKSAAPAPSPRPQQVPQKPQKPKPRPGPPPAKSKGKGGPPPGKGKPPAGTGKGGPAPGKGSSKPR